MALTDLFGDVPYSEAFRGDNVTPVYDAQSDIYQAEDGILDNLVKGIEAIENYTGNIPLEGDILFDGNLTQWIQFANSLRIKALMRISDRVAISDELTTIYNENNFITINADNAIFQFSSAEPNNYRMARLRAGDFNNFVMSETAEEVFTNYDDPRIETLYRPYANATGNDFNGLINGIDASQTTISLADYSLGGTIFREDAGNLKANYMTAWETNFFLAEAAEKGYIPATAANLYDLAVSQAFEYWGVIMPTDYLTVGNAVYDSNIGVEQIITQKWMASVINGYEGWIEYRRTGFPALKAVSASLNDGLIPVRMPYPAEEATLNTVNYNTATASNGNSINSTVWWD